MSPTNSRDFSATKRCGSGNRQTSLVKKLADGPQFHWWFPWWFYWKANLAGETPKDTPKLQWPFQDPKMKVPTMYKAYFSGLNFKFSGDRHPKYGQKYGTNVPPSIGSWRSPIENSPDHWESKHLKTLGEIRLASDIRSEFPQCSKASVILTCIHVVYIYLYTYIYIYYIVIYNMCIYIVYVYI